jgi:hypothetical protein
MKTTDADTKFIFSYPFLGKTANKLGYYTVGLFFPPFLMWIQWMLAWDSFFGKEPIIGLGILSTIIFILAMVMWIGFIYEIVRQRDVIITEDSIEIKYKILRNKNSTLNFNAIEKISPFDSEDPTLRNSLMKLGSRIGRIWFPPHSGINIILRNNEKVKIYDVLNKAKIRKVTEFLTTKIT